MAKGFVSILIHMQSSVRETQPLEVSASPESRGLEAFMRLLYSHVGNLYFHYPGPPEQLHNIEGGLQFETWPKSPWPSARSASRSNMAERFVLMSSGSMNEALNSKGLPEI